MDAVYSGQAGVMALVEGAEARVRRADDYDSEFTIGFENVGYLFLGCTDVTVVKGAREDAVRAPFENAWLADRALRLFIISLDPEEDDDLRLEASDCLEELLGKNKATRAFIENELYARELPSDADPTFLSEPSRWTLVSEMTKSVVANQASIRERRNEWEKLPNYLFEDYDKTYFEEEAIRLGAFRKLALIEDTSEDPNLAILYCYQALSGLPNSRAVINAWTANLKRPGLKLRVAQEDGEEVSDTPEVRAHDAFEHSRAQRVAIVEKLKAGSLNLARRYCDQLIRFQLENGGPEYAAKSLCDLAQEAKYLHLFSVQLEWAQRAVDINPSDSWTHGQAADALIQFSRLDEALSELALSERLGDAQFAATGRARVLRRQGKLEEALLAFRAARESFKDHEEKPFAWWGAAETLREMWRPEDALKEYELGLAEFPDVNFLRCGRAATLAVLGRLDDALAAYEAAELRNDLVALNGRASVLKDLGKFRQASEVISRAIELYPSDPISRCGQAEIMRLQGNLEGALQLYDFVRTNHPTIPSAYSGYAEVLRDMRKLGEAIAAYEAAEDRFPEDAIVASGYANILKVNDNLSEALRVYERNVRRFPFDLISKSGCADLLKRFGNYEDALAAYDEILKIWPEYESARNGKAAILVATARYQEALSLLPENPPATRNDWIAWHVRGMIIMRTNRIDEAIEFLDDASKKISFQREKRYFDGALTVARLKQRKFNLASEVLGDAGGVLSNVLRLHALAGMGEMRRARVVYTELTNTCPAQLIDLRDAVAGLFGIIKSRVSQNDNWIFLRETEALLQEAA